MSGLTPTLSGLQQALKKGLHAIEPQRFGSNGFTRHFSHLKD